MEPMQEHESTISVKVSLISYCRRLRDREVLKKMDLECVEVEDCFRGRNFSLLRESSAASEDEELIVKQEVIIGPNPSACANNGRQRTFAEAQSTASGRSYREVSQRSSR